MSALNNLRIVKREEWGAGLSDTWPASPNWGPVSHTPQMMVVHHTVTNNKQGNAHTVRAIWRYHARTQDWGDIRYHYLIGQDGIIYEGRWRGTHPANIFVEGGQSMASNTDKIGIVLLGQFEPTVSPPTPGEPTPEALQALVQLLGAIAYDLELDPLGQCYQPIEQKSYPTIAGHRDHHRTTCPGGNLYAQIVDIRDEVTAEVERLRHTQPTPARTIELAAASNQVAWGKSVWAKLLWGNQNLFSGSWWSTHYATLIEFALPPDIVQAGQLTALSLTLTGKNATYLRDANGQWQVDILAGPLRGNKIDRVSFVALQNAATVATFSPQLTALELQPGQPNNLTLDPNQLPAVQQAINQGYLALRITGPADGRRLFAWNGELGQGSPRLTVTFQNTPGPPPTLSDVIVKDIAFERIPPSHIRLAALVANVGQAVTPQPVVVSFYVDGQPLTTGQIDPLPAGKSRAVRAADTFLLTGNRTITAIVDPPDHLPETQEDNNTRTELIDFGTEQDYLADTIIQAVYVGQAPLRAGQSLTFTAQVKNIGLALTGDVVGVAFWLDGQYLTFGTLPAMPAGASQTVTAVAPWTASVGSHTLLAIVDDIDRFAEQSETNNRFTLTCDILPADGPHLPDSTIEALSFTTEANGQITLTATVANQGPAPTPDIVGVAFFVDDRYVTYGITQPMAAGATEEIRAVQTVSISGTHKITAIVDDVNRYDELNQQNNVFSQFRTF